MNDKVIFLIFATPFISASFIGLFVFNDGWAFSIPLFLMVFLAIPLGAICGFGENKKPCNKVSKE